MMLALKRFAFILCYGLTGSCVVFTIQTLTGLPLIFVLFPAVVIGVLLADRVGAGFGIALVGDESGAELTESQE